MKENKQVGKNKVWKMPSKVKIKKDENYNKMVVIWIEISIHDRFRLNWDSSGGRR